jgi:protein-disulfide isomerase
MRSPLVWLFLVVAVVLATAVWRLNNYQLSTNSNQPTTISYQSSITKSPSQVEILPSDPSLGPSQGAKVTIIEFSDFECPYCAEVAPLLKSVVNNHPGEVRLVWKDFPLPSHSQAALAAEAARCAGLQGKFWDYHDKLWLKQSELNQTVYYDLADEVGLNRIKFNQCVSDRQTGPLVERNFAEGQAVGVDGTPWLVINGQVYSGSITLTELEQIIGR